MIRDYILEKPITIGLTLLSARTFFYGWAFGISSPSAVGLLVWNYIAETGVDPVMFGWLLVVVSVLGIISLFTKLKKITYYLLTAQALVWLYVAVCYALNIDFIFAVISGLIPSLLIGYLNAWKLHFSHVKLRHPKG